MSDLFINFGTNIVTICDILLVCLGVLTDVEYGNNSVLSQRFGFK